MTCHNCKSDCKKFGFFGPERIQRYRCKQCGKCYADIPERPLDALRVSFDKAVQITHMLCEGVGIRACARLTHTHRDTVLAILELAGRKAASLMDKRVRNHPFEFVQVDELFCFVGCKERNNEFRDENIGEQYVYLGIDAVSKFIINSVTGKRNAITTQLYMQDLKKRVKTPFQLSTDAYGAYKAEVYWNFFDDVHYGQIHKNYENPKEHDYTDRRYSPSQFVSVEKRIISGNPSYPEISTSYVERTNLSVRLFNRRFTRLTLGYSKKLANLKHSVALLIAHFNFCRVHSAHKQTPAMACGLADRVWMVADLLQS